MGRIQINNIDNGIRFPGTIEVTEKRAPTDESIKLLNEMQEKAVDNILCKISNGKGNTFKWEAYFMNFVSFETLSPSGILIIKMVVNGHKYQRKVKVSSNLMTNLKPGDLGYFDLDFEARRFLYVQLCFLLGEVLLEDPETFGKVMEDMRMANITNIDYKTLAEVEE